MGLEKSKLITRERGTNNLRDLKNYLFGEEDGKETSVIRYSDIIHDLLYRQY